ncbi:MAG: hypothetical protein N2317_08620 [Syntrophales bacterium]|nr:hypothetical protein [Syntrophales bacterium]
MDNENKKEVMKVDMGSEGTKPIRMDFPSNSHKSRQEKEETKKVEKVVTGPVVARKKSLGKRVLETFIGDDINSVGSYILHDVLIPAAKATITDMVQGGIEMFLYGERKGSRTRRENGRSYVSYNSYSSSSPRRDDRDRRDISSKNRARHSFDDIILSSRGEAEEVLSNLVDLVLDYGQASVSDLYELVGITANFTDNKYGWTDLASASVSRVRDGYMINLPKPVLLD